MEISRRNSQSLFVAISLEVRTKGNGCRICGGELFGCPVTLLENTLFCSLKQQAVGFSYLVLSLSVDHHVAAYLKLFVY